MRYSILLVAASLFAVPACDQGTDDSTLREKLAVELDGVSLSLTDAIAIAQTEHPSATVVEADLDLEHGVTVYDIELYADGVAYELDISPDDGAILDREQKSVDADHATELQAAADLVIASTGWADIIAAAEAETGATVFEVDADGDDGVLEVEALSDAGIHELELTSDGTIVKSEMSDDGTWEDEEELEDDDDDHGGDDDHHGGDDDDATGDDDHGGGDDDLDDDHGATDDDG